MFTNGAFTTGLAMPHLGVFFYIRYYAINPGAGTQFFICIAEKIIFANGLIFDLVWGNWAQRVSVRKPCILLN